MLKLKMLCMNTILKNNRRNFILAKQTKPTFYQLTAGVDVGNGYTKSIINNQLSITQSQAVKRYSIVNDEKLTTEQYPDFIGYIQDIMDCSFTSPLVKDTTRRLFGERALKSHQPIEQFDIREGKADSDLYGCLLLSTLACHIMKQHYAQDQTFPTQLNAQIKLSTALPINEFKKKNREFRERILNNGQPHLVTFHNFAQPITVQLTIEKVHLASEGEAAQYGLVAAEDPLIQDVEKEIKAHYGNLYEDYTGLDFLTAPNTLGIDIGEGTMDFAVFTNNKFERELSQTVNQGYRTVLENTLDELAETGATYRSTKELAEALTHQPSKFERQRWNHMHEINRKYTESLCDFIKDECSKVFSRVGTFINVVFVYGGGATALKDYLYARLDRLSDSRGEYNKLPIVYLDNKYSQFLNAQGLYLLASQL